MRKNRAFGLTPCRDDTRGFFILRGKNENRSEGFKIESISENR